VKRTAEFVLGLVGGIIGILLSFLGFFIAFVAAASDDQQAAGIIFIVTLLFFVIQAGALIVGCLVNRMNHKLFGGLMIAFGVLSFPISIFLMFVPSVLYIIAGALGFRVPQERQERQEHSLMLEKEI
jgi:hypothetical protein